MNSLLFTVISFLVALGVLITVHEFGHFWVARRLGIKVLRFSIGFGTPLWKRTGTVDGTEYVVAAIPLGGYVKMLDEREGEVPEQDLQRAFNRQSLAVRSAVVAAGPLFNFLFAIIAYWLVFVTGDVGTKPVVGEVTPTSIAAEAGFLVGDEFLAVGGRDTGTWESVVYALLSESVGDEDIAVRVRDSRGLEQARRLPIGELSTMTEDANFILRVGLMVQQPILPAVFGELVPGEMAEQAGIQSGDRVLAVAGEMVADWPSFVSYIRDHPDQLIALRLERAGAPLTLDLKIAGRKVGGKVIGRIGAGVYVPEGVFDAYRTEVKLGPIGAIGASIMKSWDMSVFMLRMVGRMVSGKSSLDNLGGPISIAQSAGRSASYGAVYFLKFLAVVSISLGILNLLPVPVLDGGHLLFFLIEGVKGSPLSEQMQELGQRIGLAALLLLMGLAFYVDILRLLG